MTVSTASDKTMPSPGRIILTHTRPIISAIAVVNVNSKMVLIPILLSLFKSFSSAMADTMEKNTSGTITIRINLINTLPRNDIKSQTAAIQPTSRPPIKLIPRPTTIPDTREIMIICHIFNLRFFFAVLTSIFHLSLNQKTRAHEMTFISFIRLCMSFLLFYFNQSFNQSFFIALR